MFTKHMGLFVLFAVIFTMTLVGATEADAMKAQGVTTTQYGSATKHIVCGDTLCSDIPGGYESWIKERNGIDVDNTDDTLHQKTSPSDESSELTDMISDIKAIHVAGNVSMITGSVESLGGNIGVSSGDDGILIVDDGLIIAIDDIMEQLDELKTCDTCDDVKFLLNTHWHFDHVENNAHFGDKHDTVIVAHSNVRELLSSPQEFKSFGMKFDASPKKALPVITFDESVSLHFNGDEIKVKHVPNGHTSSDSIVYFTESNVLHLGDHFFNGAFPFIDLEHGGTLRGMTDNVKYVIDTFPADVKIIPGHGILASMDDLTDYHTMLVETTTIVQDQLNAGKTLDEIHDTGLPDKWRSWGMGFVNESFWIETIHANLSVN